MGQIVKRKKKGRPSKADLAAEKKAAAAAASTQRELRRSGRRRSARYNLDFDDYLDDDEYYFDEEDERRREKKLKLLLKLHGASDLTNIDSPFRQAPAASSASDDEDNPSKKRKIDAGDEEVDVDENDEVEDEDTDVNNIYDDDVKVGRRKEEVTKGVDSAPGTPSEPLSGFPLPEKKTLEVILDKLQKKDIYGVYAEPVDPEELPDYHDVIEHPMDFSTVRKKLANGSYATLEQFKSDVFLICSNAMQYNAPDTIYHKQARSIQELAKKKFQKLKMANEPSEKEVRLEPNPNSLSFVKKPIRKTLSRTPQEPVGSDFSSGTMRTTAGDFHNCSNVVQTSGVERPNSLDGLVEGNASILDTSLDKVEESLPVKSCASRFGRRMPVHDENRRGTYNISSQAVDSSESIFSTFDGEDKQLIPVGLYVDYSYARSLARFAGSLGPAAWSVASKRIEQLLPQGTKFGRGWVGEYEPLPTPVLMLENCTIREPAFFMKPRHTFDTRKDEKSAEPVPFKDVTGPKLGGKFPFCGPPGIKTITSSSTAVLPPAKETSFRRINTEGKPPMFCSPGSNAVDSDSSSLMLQNSHTRNFVESEKKVLKPAELNCPTSTDRSSTHVASDRQVPSATEVLIPRSVDMVSMKRHLLPCGSFKQPISSEVCSLGGPTNVKVIRNSLNDNAVVNSSSDLGNVATYFARGQEQALSDPVQLMRRLTEKNQSQQKAAQSPNAPPVPSSAQCSSKEDSGNAAAAAARAWMSIGAGGFRPSGDNVSLHKNQISADSLYNPTRDMQHQVSRFRGDFPHPVVHFQPDKNSFPVHAFAPQPSKVSNPSQFHNRQMVFPQLAAADLSRFQMQSPWRSVSPRTQQIQKQETLPPDLNISFQSPSSPGRPSSGMLVDSQQPDLALQL